MYLKRDRWHVPVSKSGCHTITPGRVRTQQIVTTACYDLVDIVGWEPLPDKWTDHPSHAHNRLLTSIVLNNEERKMVARAHNAQLAKAIDPVALLMPDLGLGEWDREGADLHNKEGLACFLQELRDTVPENVQTYPIKGHLNDPIFTDVALQIFDEWRANGVVAG